MTFRDVPADLHTSIVTEAHIVSINYYHGYRVPNNVTIDYFDDLDCKIKEKLKEDMASKNFVNKHKTYEETVNSRTAIKRTHANYGVGAERHKR